MGENYRFSVKNTKIYPLIWGIRPKFLKGNFSEIFQFKLISHSMLSNSMGNGYFLKFHVLSQIFGEKEHFLRFYPLIWSFLPPGIANCAPQYLPHIKNELFNLIWEATKFLCWSKAPEFKKTTIFCFKMQSLPPDLGHFARIPRKKKFTEIFQI